MKLCHEWHQFTKGLFTIFHSDNILILQAKEIVLRHVVGAKVSAQDVATGPVETLGGETIELVKHHNGGIQIKGPTTSTHVILANIFATNGVIHVIDSVIL